MAGGQDARQATGGPDPRRDRSIEYLEDLDMATAPAEYRSETLAPFRKDIVIATKFGFGPDPGNDGKWTATNSRADHIAQVVEASLKRL